MKDYIPFVYIIKHKSSGMKYIGVRYAKGCHPDDLWTTYFTSSNLVKRLIEEFGKDDFYYKVIHRFPQDPEAAVLQEAYYFKFIKQRDDYLNLTYSSGFQDLRISSKGGKVGGTIVYKKKIGIFRDEEERRKWASLGGKASFQSGNNEKWMYWCSPEGRKKRSSMGGIASGNFKDKDFQSEMGSRGGPKNKGFKWYTDGVENYKYTARQQQILPFEEFLNQNPNFRKGRGNSYDLTGSIAYNDGIKNLFYGPRQQQILPFEEFLNQNPNFRRGKIKKLKQNIEKEESNETKENN